MTENSILFKKCGFRLILIAAIILIVGACGNQAKEESDTATGELPERILAQDTLAADLIGLLSVDLSSSGLSDAQVAVILNGAEQAITQDNLTQSSEISLVAPSVV